MVSGGTGDRKPDAVRIARRAADIQPFHVMDILARARGLEAVGRSIIHMEIGEPDFPTPQPILEEAAAALNTHAMHYTPALGLPQLRESISAFYASRYGVTVPPRRIVVTPGSSGALLLAMGVIVNPGDEVLMADPGYPCNRHFVRFTEGVAVSVPVGPDTGYQLTMQLLEERWSERTVAALVASPSNPTGTLMLRDTLGAAAHFAEAKGGRLIVDEIYHGLTYGEDAHTVLALTDSAFVINSFSKYFGMTGWRLGWLVVPSGYEKAVERLAQNLFIAPSAPAQYAAMAAFRSSTLAVLEERKAAFQTRRDYLVQALRHLGFRLPVTPQGAFYLYADCSPFTSDSFAFAAAMLEEAGVAVTPGVDFGSYRSREQLRFAYTTSLDNLKEGVGRLETFLDRYRVRNA